MKKLIVILMLILVIPLMATYTRHDALLLTSVDILATGTATNEAEFTSKDLLVYNVPIIGVTAIFSRAAGSASNIDFVFEVCYDGGSNGPPVSGAHWATFVGAEINVATNTEVVTGTTVRVFYEISVYGASHFRLKSVKNNDGANDITGVNVVVSR